MSRNPGPDDSQDDERELEFQELTEDFSWWPYVPPDDRSGYMGLEEFMEYTLPTVKGFETTLSSDGTVEEVVSTIRIRDGSTSHEYDVTFGVGDGVAGVKTTSTVAYNSDEFHISDHIEAIVAAEQTITRVDGVEEVDRVSDAIQDAEDELEAILEFL